MRQPPRVTVVMELNCYIAALCNGYSAPKIFITNNQNIIRELCSVGSVAQYYQKKRHLVKKMDFYRKEQTLHLVLIFAHNCSLKIFIFVCTH